MKIYKSRTKNTLYYIYRLIAPIIDPIKLYKGLSGYIWYLQDIMKVFPHIKKKWSFIKNLFPILDEKTSETKFDAHYFYNPIWAFSHIKKTQPKFHVDVASDYRLSGYLSTIIHTIFVDIRPIPTDLQNLEVIKGSALELPFKSEEIPSLSCLHVIEHIGLGRYGDPIDVLGHEKAATEFTRVLKRGGLLYIAVPIGKEKTCFNAHRIFSPLYIIDLFDKFNLEEFSVITDNNKYIELTNPKLFLNQDYACGLFIFKKK